MEEIFKTRLKEEIKQSNMTTREIASLVGVSPEMITQYCTTKKLPKLDTFVKICKALNVSANYLLGMEDM